MYSLVARAWRDLYLLAGQCAACGYSIGDLRSAEDGCTVCPECGGAWRLLARTSPPVGGPSNSV
ncbi:MAG: hypothetical protein KF768_12735 [Phycisphaeraceae bacterium]|nr:hypothetical protein [Phycisphaeraceae bacterium]